MYRNFLPQRYFSAVDIVIILLLASIIYGLVAFGHQWQGEFHPVTEIDLSARWLPIYTFYSGVRGSVAYLISLGFTLVVGYTAAKSPKAEKILIPILDIMQSIPVLGFLPGLVLGLIAIFPHNNIGLELSAIIMVFTGQVWNMTFSFYSSLKSVPTELKEAASVMKLGRMKTFRRLELPFSAVGLAWNSLMSMAGGWFFLSVAEAFSLGKREFQLPGVGSYMAVAIKEGDTHAMILGITAMVALILFMDILIWRPVLAWVHRFRLEEIPGVTANDPLVKMMIRESKVLRWMKVIYRIAHRRLHWRLIGRHQPKEEGTEEAQAKKRKPFPRWAVTLFQVLLVTVFGFMMSYGTVQLFGLLRQLDFTTWIILIRNTVWTLCRIAITLVLSTVWAVPVGIWIGTSPRRIRIAQPIVQVLASFPAPMLYPLALSIFFGLGISFDFGSMFLMMLGVQWYVLFNVLAGAMRIPQELKYAVALMKVPARRRWTALYLPSVFPALVTGWVTAAGGAWNASIVAEAIAYRGQSLTTSGLGATITEAVSKGDFPLLAASLLVMVLVVVLLNRTLWAKIYHLTQTRFRLDF